MTPDEELAFAWDQVDKYKTMTASWSGKAKANYRLLGEILTTMRAGKTKTALGMLEDWDTKRQENLARMIAERE